MLARCQKGSPTSVTDRRDGAVLQRSLDSAGRPAQAGSGAKPFTGAPQPWLDLRRVTVNVPGNLLCVTIRNAARVPKDTPVRYALRIAEPKSQSSSEPSVLLIGPGVAWLPPATYDLDEAQVAHAYRERGNTISVAVRIDVEPPRGVLTPYAIAGFDRFRWSMRSASGSSVLRGDGPYKIVDCAPQNAWISYPKGRRTEPPRVGDKAAPCTKP